MSFRDWGKLRQTNLVYFHSTLLIPSTYALGHCQMLTYPLHLTLLYDLKIAGKHFYPLNKSYMVPWKIDVSPFYVDSCTSLNKNVKNTTISPDGGALDLPFHMCTQGS